MSSTPPLPPVQCVDNFLQQAVRLGIEVRWTREGMHDLDAAYHALPGVPGKIMLHDRDPRPTTAKLCTLLSHEMVHVLQHWKGKLNALPPLGWPRNGAPTGRNLSLQEQEAYTAQSKPRFVLHSVTQLKKIEPGNSP